ncbi:MAG: WGR domain-containing protein [Amylibacter sp.]|jgi:predicted DNA-binding WGR domain protein
MTQCLMFKTATQKTSPRYYRLEILTNLFEEFSVLREWGMRGGKGRQNIQLFPDLMSASLAADQIREKKLNTGYSRAI